GVAGEGGEGGPARPYRRTGIVRVSRVKVALLAATLMTLITVSAASTASALEPLQDSVTGVGNLIRHPGPGVRATFDVHSGPSGESPSGTVVLEPGAQNVTVSDNRAFIAGTFEGGGG